jgi:hypothetical protein
MTTAQSPSWPTDPVAYGPVVLREFSAADLPMVREMSADPYVPLIGTLPSNASAREAQAYIDRQRGRLAEGTGFSFVIAEAGTGRGVGQIGLWLAGLDHGRASAGYSVIPSARTRRRGGRADGADLLRVDHPGVAPHRALHRAVERGVGRDRRARRIRTRGPAAKPSGDRRPPPGHAPLRDDQGSRGGVTPPGPTISPSGVRCTAQPAGRHQR